eukprot:m.72808 g.72808  ORF g.72808 m.72808 type:complete len:67 (-) comp12343_c0_seq1:385-585(-)
MRKSVLCFYSVCVDLYGCFYMEQVMCTFTAVCSSLCVQYFFVVCVCTSPWTKKILLRLQVMMQVLT